MKWNKPNRIDEWTTRTVSKCGRFMVQRGDCGVHLFEAADYVASGWVQVLTGHALGTVRDAKGAAGRVTRGVA